jgi:hypothetical protein
MPAQSHFIRGRMLALAAALALAIPSLVHAADIALRGRVYGNRTNVHAIYVGESTNYVTVRGDGDTDLDCWIYDSYGRLVDSDTDDTDYCVLRTPGIGTHRVVITNNGGVYNDYVVSRL